MMAAASVAANGYRIHKSIFFRFIFLTDSVGTELSTATAAAAAAATSHHSLRQHAKIVNNKYVSTTNIVSCARKSSSHVWPEANLSSSASMGARVCS